MLMGHYSELEKALDAEAYDWLEHNQPTLLTSLEHAVTMGAEPGLVLRHVIEYAGEHRKELAKRLELAARHIKRTMDRDHE